MARRDTRELILATALALFNEQGEPNVTTNQIAIEADISPGNLYYHFRSREDIALELFKRYLLLVQPLLERTADDAPEFEDLWLRLHLIFEAMARFRFLFRDLADLHARVGNLRHAFHGLLARQRSVLQELIEGLEKRGVMAISERDAGILADNIMLNMTYWIPYAEIQGQARTAEGQVPNEAVARVLHLVMPYLREPEATQVSALAQRYRAP
jgi:AcrR family transcriptional regulator